jgi:dTDP-4-amino-4,6-dideoxygalactose transaminase
MHIQVPFLDLKSHHAPMLDEINRAIQEVIESAAFAGGPFVTAFEEDFAKYCDVPYAVGVGSGTEALWMTLLALGVGPGDEVITVPNSFMATAEAITYCGATPVFVDVDERTYTLDPAALGKAVTSKTKAIIPVHLFGQPAAMGLIMEFARKQSIYVVEDACQAHGAKYNGKRVGALADAACFSFYPGKNLGAFGEAGAIVTCDADLAKKIRLFRDHGQIRKYHHSVIGWNGRMDGIQAAVLRIKLRHLDEGNDLRRSHAARYDEALKGVRGVVTPGLADSVQHVYHLYALRVKNRDEVVRRLADQGIGYGIHYPVPIHLQEAYRSLGYDRGSFPTAEQCANEFVSLPMFPELTSQQLDLVTGGVKEALARSLEN